jgi:hypothetical protein
LESAAVVSDRHSTMGGAGDREFSIDPDHMTVEGG